MTAIKTWPGSSYVTDFLYLNEFLTEKIHILQAIHTSVVTTGPNKGNLLGKREQWMLKSLPVAENKQTAMARSI